MKKSKVVLVIVLAVVLIATTISVPTVSWFIRPQSQKGNSLTLNDTETAYNGYNVTMSTTASTDGSSYSAVTNSNGLSGSGIEKSGRKYYKTTIKNNSSTAQNVSLYISKVSIPTTSNGNFCLGVNGPTRSFRDYTALSTPSHMKSGEVKRVYFQPNNANEWTGGDYYVCWTTSDVTLDSTGSNGTYYHLSLSGQGGTYYADLPLNANKLFFSVANWGTNDNGKPKWWQRTQTFTDLTSDGLSVSQSLVFKLKGTATGYNNADAEKFTANGANVMECYSDIFVAAGNTFSAALTANTHYKGSAVEYDSGNTGVFTVNKNSGLITAVAEGEAKLITKVKGQSFSDDLQVETTVKVTGAQAYEFSNIPIAKNIKIPASEGENEIVVNWYVMNPLSAGNNLRYTIDGIYLGG